MHTYTAGPFVTDLLIGYMTLFSIINPFGVAFVFLTMTGDIPNQARKAIAHRVGLYSFIILVASLFIGSQIMRFFGITIPALRIAGGMVVALSGWSMLTAPDAGAARTVPQTREAIEGMIFFPLTVPLTTGPGSIAAAIALGANRTGPLREIFANVIASLLIAVLVAATVTFAFANADKFARWVGREGTRVISRLSAFLLICVGMQIILTGLADVVPPLISHGLELFQAQQH
jgi:multiple antibiotic resistance protein